MILKVPFYSEEWVDDSLDFPIWYRLLIEEVIGINHYPLLESTQYYVLIDLYETTGMVIVPMWIINVDGSIDSHVSKYLNVVLCLGIDVLNWDMISIYLMCYYTFTVQHLTSHWYTCQHWILTHQLQSVCLQIMFNI